jgi:hypothetical protein
MQRFNAPLEIHVHGQVMLRTDVRIKHLEEALKPVLNYVGARSFDEGAPSGFEDEPGLQFNRNDNLLQMCWTVFGDDDFRQPLEEACMNLNELASAGSAIEITFYDADFEPEEDNPDIESRDDFMVLFVGPTPAAIMQAQRDLLVHDMVHMMERHFEANELTGVIAEVDKLFANRFDALINSLDISKSKLAGNAGSVRGSARKSRRLH